MSVGKEIKSLYDEMLKVFSETSHFISVLNDLFVSKGWQPVGGNAVMWDRSNHYAYPRFWMPYFQQRIFTLGPDSRHAVGINILFDEPYGDISNTIPFISCVCITMEDGQPLGKSDEIYGAGWDSDAMLDKDFSKIYKSYYPGRMTLVNYFLPFDIITNQESVTAYILQPLVQMYEGEIGEAYEAIEGVCLTKEELSA